MRLKLKRGVALGLIEKLKEEFSFFRGNFLILIISWILMDFVNELPGTYYPDYVVNLGGTPTILGIISAVSFLALALVQFPGGYLADKYGRKWLVSSLTFGVAISYIFYAVAPSWHFILIGALFANLCLLYQPALNALFADSLPPEKRGMGFSIVNLITSVSTTPAPLIAMFLVTTYGPILGMRIAYVIVTIFYFAAAVVRLKLKESMKNVDKLDLKDAVKSIPRSLREGIEVWRRVPRSTFFLFLSRLILGSAFAMCQPLFQIYAFYVLQIGGAPNPNLPPDQDPALQLARIYWGYAMMVVVVCMIILSFPVGRLIDKIGRKKPLILAGLLIIPATLLFVYGNYLTLFISFPIVSLSQLLMFSSFQALFADLVAQDKRGTVTGSMNFFSYIFMAVGGFIGGLLYDKVSPQFPFLLIPVLSVPSTLLVLFYVHEPKPEDREL
ncbi:MFS transporter [Candidatus Bathyarchaeota archaeon]|nr:MFS transporter [Candidatus Bathyarchaeota archaeon]